MIDAATLSTLGFALIAGVGTFFSPCAYPLLPGYVGYYVSQTDGEQASLVGALSRGIAAAIGVLATLGVLVGIAFEISHSRMENLQYVEPVVGVLLLGFGLLLVFDRAPSLSIPLPRRRSSVLGFAVFGAGYALAAAGCVASLFTGVVARSVSLPAAEGVLVLGTYVGSIVLLMVSLTVATGMGLVASAGRLAAYSEHLERFAGVVMIVAGLGQLYLSVVILDVL